MGTKIFRYHGQNFKMFLNNKVLWYKSEGRWFDPS